MSLVKLIISNYGEKNTLHIITDKLLFLYMMDVVKGAEVKQIDFLYCQLLISKKIMNTRSI